MRIWSIHPEYLDAKGLVALWRETLLAQNVLLDNTKGYKNHPQLLRFKEQEFPIQAISNYLHDVCNEAENRNYNFNRDKIHNSHAKIEKIPVTSGQIEYEWQHFLRKIKIRDQNRFQQLKNEIEIKIHPVFAKVEGQIEKWEIIK